MELKEIEELIRKYLLRCDDCKHKGEPYPCQWCIEHSQWESREEKC